MVIRYRTIHRNKNIKEVIMKKVFKIALAASAAAVVLSMSASAEDVIKIGWLAPLTGTAAENGQ